jgi:REP element-mobilizing transposase RayT
LRWYLITWTTRGSWLPGDSRGFRTYRHKVDIPPPKRYANGQNGYQPLDWQQLLQHSRRISKGEVRLSSRHQHFVRRRTTEIASECGSSIAAIHIGDTHVHIIIRLADGDLPKLVQRLKGVTSRELSQYGLNGAVWTRGYHARRIPDAGLAQATRYLLEHK